MLFFNKKPPLQYYKVWFIGDNSRAYNTKERYIKEHEPTGIVALHIDKECWIHMDNACMLVDWENHNNSVLYEEVSKAQYETYVEFELFPVLKVSRQPFYKMLKKFRIYLTIANILMYAVLGIKLEMHFEMGILGVLTTVMILLVYHGLNEMERNKVRAKSKREKIRR